MFHLSQTIVEQFFEVEKEDARGVLRKEMDSCMDTIFKQMKRKLMQLLESGHRANETEHRLANLGDPVDREQLYHSSNSIPSTSINSNFPYNTNSNQMHDDEITFKNELGEMVNIIQNEAIPPSSTPENKQSSDNIDDLFDEEEEECDCPECVGDLHFLKDEGDEHDEDADVQLVDDINETDNSNHKPTKRLRPESDITQDQAQLNNQTNPNQFITISLKCPQCTQMFHDRSALNVHLKSVHSIEKHRCLYKDCNLSFDKHQHLSHYHRTVHLIQPNAIWPCGHCSGHFKSNKSLLTHHWTFHEEGIFECSQTNCHFVAQLKQTVIYHFGINHKGYVCQYRECAKRYQHPYELKTHERTHRSAKPYRCKWPQCQYCSAYKVNAIAHIRSHLRKTEYRYYNKQYTNISMDPKHYLEVVDEFL